jgi:hypothetical protein
MNSPHDADLDALATAPVDADDERVLERMANLYTRLDPPPRTLVERINFGITLDALHAEIAELQRGGDLAGVRSEGATEAKTVTFTSASLSLMISISAISADRARIDGWAAPGGGVEVELRSVDGSFLRTADQDGRFVFADVPRGLAQFTVRQPNGDPRPPVITPSLEI